MLYQFLFEGQDILRLSLSQKIHERGVAVSAYLCVCFVKAKPKPPAEGRIPRLI